jgi:hypothetical protein
VQNCAYTLARLGRGCGDGPTGGGAGTGLHTAGLERAPGHARLGVPSNLPGELSTFVGRADDLERGARLVGGSRLVTFTGAGGCGKTRLARQVAARVAERFAGGVWWVELASLADGALVTERAAEAGETLTLVGHHLAWAADFAQRFERDVERAAPEYLDLVERELPNIRAALDHAANTPDLGHNGLRLMSALAFFWTQRGYAAEGADYGLRVVAGDPAAPPALRARARWGGAYARFTPSISTGRPPRRTPRLRRRRRPGMRPPRDGASMCSPRRHSWSPPVRAAVVRVKPGVRQG